MTEPHEALRDLYVVHLEPDGPFWHVWVPSLVGARSSGDSRFHALEGIREAIAAAEGIPDEDVGSIRLEVHELRGDRPRRARTQGTLARTSEERRLFGTYKTPPGSISWVEHEEVWLAYRKRYGTSQNAEQIHARGGFGKEEAEMILGRPLKTWEAHQVSDL